MAKSISRSHDDSSIEACSHPTWSLLSICLWALVLLLSAIFLYASGNKLVDVSRFQTTINNYRILPGWAAFALARYLPLMEITLAAGLLLPRWRRAASLCLAILLLVFTAATLIAAVRGINLACGCFGATEQEPASLSWLLMRNAGLLAMAMIAFVVSPSKNAVSS